MNFEWDPLKNEAIKDEHGISFEEIVELIGKGFLLKVLANPSRKYKGQKVFLIQRGHSIFMVPFEKRNKKWRLITAFYHKDFTETLLR